MFYLDLGCSLASCLWQPSTCHKYCQKDFWSWHKFSKSVAQQTYLELVECWLWQQELPLYGVSEKGSFLQTLGTSPRELGRAPPTCEIRAWYHQFGVKSAWSGQLRGRGGGGGGGQRWWAPARGCACPGPSPCPAGWEHKGSCRRMMIIEVGWDAQMLQKHLRVAVVTL